MEKFKEKIIVKISTAISIIMIVCWLMSLLIGAFYNPFLIGFLLLPIATIPMLITTICSDEKKYTRDFILYINNKISEAKTLDELEAILKEFESLAIENKTYCLSFPIALKAIHRDILSRISILEKQSK